MRDTRVSSTRRRTRAGLGWAVLGLLLAAAGCEDSGPSTPGDPAIGVALSASALEVTQGQSGTVTATLTRAGGYTAPINLSLENAPEGVTAVFAPASVGNGTSTSTLTLTANPSEVVGTFTVTVRAKGQGVDDKTASLTLTVRQAEQPAPFTLTLEPNDVTLQQGGTASVLARVARHNGFGGPVQLTVLDNPPPLGVGVPTITTDEGTINLALNGNGTLAPGSYSVVLRAHVTASAFEQTVTLTVRVTAAGGSVAWRFCDASALPQWFAYQSDEGAWTFLTPTGNAFDFTVGTRGGVAWVEHAGSGSDEYQTQVFFGTAAELAAVGDQACTRTSPSSGKRLTGSVAGVSFGDVAQVQMGPAWVRTQPVSPSFTLKNVPNGPQDLVATRIRSVVNGDDYTFTPDRFIIRRGLDLPNNAAIPVLDFGSAEAFEPALATLTIQGLGSDEAMLSAGYLTGNGGAGAVGAFLGGYYMGMPSAESTRSYPGVPATRQAAGDLHMLMVSTGNFGDDSDPAGRGSVSFFGTATDRSITLGPALSAPAVSVVEALPIARPRIQFARQPEYGALGWVSFWQGERGLTIMATAGYFGGSPAAWELTTPPFASMAGYHTTGWGLRSGVETEWSASAYGVSGALSNLFAPVDGTTWQTAQRSGKMTP